MFRMCAESLKITSWTSEEYGHGFNDLVLSETGGGAWAVGVGGYGASLLYLILDIAATI